MCGMWVVEMRMKMLNAFLILATVLLALTSIIFFAWNSVADAIYFLVWAVLVAVIRRIRGETT